MPMLLIKRVYDVVCFWHYWSVNVSYINVNVFGHFILCYKLYVTVYYYDTQTSCLWKLTDPIKALLTETYRSTQICNLKKRKPNGHFIQIVVI